MTQTANHDISVIVTSYNQKEYLKEAIDSVLGQTLLPSEIVVVDADSSDGSPELIREYANSYEIVRRLLLSEDPGIPEMRNRALERVEGDYVAVLDGDDRFLPNKVERELEAIQRHPDVAAIYSNYYIINEDSERTSLWYQETQPSGDIFAEVFSGKFGMMRSMLFQYDTIEEIGFLDPEFWHFDGFDLTVALAKEYNLVYIDEPLAEYRRHSGGAAAWRGPEDQLPELRGIFEKHKSDLSQLPNERQRTVTATWNSILSLFEARLARERGDYLNSLRLYLKAARFDRPRVINYKKIAKTLLPKSIYRRLQTVYWNLNG